MNRSVYILAALALFLAGGARVSAQGGYSVSGTVQDQLGPVIGATVVEQGTANGTSTGIDGGFSLTEKFGLLVPNSQLFSLMNISYKLRFVKRTSRSCESILPEP